jgi:hypothetical protein
LKSNGRRLRVEPLEVRDLLSVSLPGFAVPNYVAHSAANDVTPLATSSPTGYTPAQIRQAYGFDQISFNGIAGDGAGTTIAIVDAYDDPNIANDLHQFNLQFGLPDPPVFTKVNQTGGKSYPAADAGWITEIALDVQWAHAIAPKANILLVEANDNSYANLMAAVDYARHASGVVAVSMSWGSGEFSGEKSYDSYFTTPSGHGGVTFLASSGDSGAPVSYPASSPNVVSVGGTALNLNGGGSYVSESGWSGSGGGISTIEARPTYQQGVVAQSTTFRANPDVAYDSDPNTGFPVYDSYNNPVSAPWGLWGGTSAAAPQWAALIAIADQGRALAGKGAMDGATQTLPALYSLPAADFHDITTGTSTGQPHYSARAGHDLVTGRGTPRADLVVAGLVGTTTTVAPTHFSITASTSSKAGATFSIIAKALDSSNKVVTGYQGTVHFTSSDSQAVALGLLPADYTFTSADKGIHTFAGVSLATAGKQTVTIADAATSSILGSATVTVSPAAASQLVFGQQPVVAGVGVSISPAITVRVLDAYNNLVKSDNTHVVKLSLGSNPGGGVLGGTTSVTVSGGAASFGRVSVSQPGGGYTLVATSGTLAAATSASFNVLAGTTVEDFESGDLSAYTAVGAATPTASVSTTAGHDGAYGLLDAKGTDWIYRNDSSVHVQQGDVISVWLRLAGTSGSRAFFGFGASSGGTLSLVASPGTGQLLLEKNVGYGYTVIASASQSWRANHWYRLEVDWGVSGSIVGRVFDSNGTTLLRTVKGSTTAINSGGIAFRTAGTTALWDTVQVTSGVNGFAQPAAAMAVKAPAAPVRRPIASAVSRPVDDAVPALSFPSASRAPSLPAADRSASNVAPAMAAAIDPTPSSDTRHQRSANPLDPQLVDFFFAFPRV